MTDYSTRDWLITQGTTSPEMPQQLKNPDGTPVNLTGATVSFTMRKIDSEAITSRAAVVTNAIDGRVRYDWHPSDTALPGIYYGKWEVTLANGKPSAYPSRRLIIEVTPRV